MNESYALRTLKKTVRFDNYILAAIVKEEEEQVSEVYACTFQDCVQVVKISYDENAGHWTTFTIEIKEAHDTNYRYLTTIEEYIN